MIDLKLIEPDTIHIAEKLRYQALGIQEEPNNTLYQRELESGKMLGFLLYDDGQPVAGCYVSMLFKMLNIDYVFVNKKYQHTDKKYGYQILQKVLNSKSLIEEYYGCEFIKCILEYRYEDSKKLYKKVGFQEYSNTGRMCRYF